MNEKELQIKIKELRQEGYGYKKIAKELSTSIGTVRYACLKDEEESELVGECKNCNSKIKFVKGKKKKVFCCDKCRWEWWNKNKTTVEKTAYYTHQCKQCNKDFTAYGNNKRLFCSQACYIIFKKSKGGIANETR